MKVQIEITNNCNLRCKYCIQRFWDASQLNIDPHIFREIIKNHEAEKFILYGFGEPLLHPDIENLVKTAHTKAEVLLITNGTIDNITKIAEIVDILGFSLDTLYNANVMRSSQTEKILKNIEKASKRTKIFLSVVLTKENIKEFPKIVEWAGRRGIDVTASNLVPYNSKMAENTLFLELSKKAIEICRQSIENFDEAKWLLNGVTSLNTLALKHYKELLEKLGEYHLNLEALVKNWHKIKLAEEAEVILQEASEIAKKYKIKLNLPQMFANEKDRLCPYEDAFFVRSDGKIAPCAELAYTHPLYINLREKIVKEVIDYPEEFDQKKKRIVDVYPWCGDCQFVDGCWFVEEGMDCYDNFPTCSECLYSAKIAKCLI